MKKRILALTFASAMVLSIVGCGSTSSEAGKTDLFETAETTEVTEDKPALESEDTVKTDDLGAESNIETDEISQKETADPEVNSDLEPNSFMYDGKIISILGDLQTTLDDLGADKKADGDVTGEHIYTNGKDDIEVVAREVEGKEELAQIIIHDKSVKTSRGIAVGDTEDDIHDKYGDPNDVIPVDSLILNYNFDGCSIMFTIDGTEISSIAYMKKAPVEEQNKHM